MARFIESEHPRDKDSKFTNKNKTSSSTKVGDIESPTT